MQQKIKRREEKTFLSFDIFSSKMGIIKLHKKANKSEYARLIA